MSFRTKYYVSYVTMLICVGCAVIGVAVLEGAVLTHQRRLVIEAATLLFGGVIIGIAATLSTYYYRGRQNDDRHTDRAGIEILAAAGKPQQRPSTPTPHKSSKKLN
ncbi:MAG TPA: hypothetical protein VLH84_05715 [Patescibacteria group bacterium]|nr:hypothetical protein [Patescibacteria group bacterium]